MSPIYSLINVHLQSLYWQAVSMLINPFQVLHLLSFFEEVFKPTHQATTFSTKGFMGIIYRCNKNDDGLLLSLLSISNTAMSKLMTPALVLICKIYNRILDEKNKMIAFLGRSGQSHKDEASLSFPVGQPFPGFQHNLLNVSALSIPRFFSSRILVSCWNKS